MGRPKKPIPANAAEKIRELSATGHSVVGIAQQLKTSPHTLARWMDESPELKEALDQGREKERYTLHNMLYLAATKSGNTTAAMFLLKSRHNYVEGFQGDSANRVTINFALPGAMPLADFLTVTPTKKEIEK